MKYLALYFLIGAMVAVWTAINARRTGAVDPGLAPRERLVSMLAAYALIALVWPLSIGVFLYALAAGRSGREGPEQGR